MTHEWKVGDRFSVEGVITETADSDGDYKAIFDGHTIGGCVIAAEMAQELLAYREAERKTKSWDDTEAWVQTRRKVTEFYPFARKALSFRAG